MAKELTKLTPKAAQAFQLQLFEPLMRNASVLRVHFKAADIAAKMESFAGNIAHRKLGAASQERFSVIMTEAHQACKHNREMAVAIDILAAQGNAHWTNAMEAA